MDEQLLYIVFGIVLVLALLFDLGLLSKKSQLITMKHALYQTLFWVALSVGFCIFIYLQNPTASGKTDAVQYLSAYLLEWSLSIDNIFVFIIIFAFFKIKSEYYSRVLFYGILMAIIFRILFIAVGSELVARFGWIMYVFGIFLIYTGFTLFKKDDEAGDEGEDVFDPEKSWAYKLIKKILPTVNNDGNGRFTVKINGKTFFTTLAVAVIMLGLIDIVFAVDSIPAVFSVIPDPNKKLLIYSSNIFAVLGLRSLFFLLRGAATKFDYLQQGIATVLVFIGIKMLLPLLKYAGVDDKYLHFPAWVSLLVIIVCIGGSMIYSIYHKRKYSLPDQPDVPGAE